MGNDIRGIAKNFASSLSRDPRVYRFGANQAGLKGTIRRGNDRIPWCVPTTFERTFGRVDIKRNTVTISVQGSQQAVEFPWIPGMEGTLEHHLRNLRVCELVSLLWQESPCGTGGEQGVTWSLLFAGPDPGISELADVVVVEVLGQVLLGNAGVREYGACLSYQKGGHVAMQVHNDGLLFESADRKATPVVSGFEFTVLTGDDDLRGGADNLNIFVRHRNGTEHAFANVNRGQRWADRTSATFVIRLPAAVHLGEIESILLKTAFRGGLDGDNWNMQEIRIGAMRPDGLVFPIHQAAGRDGSERGCLHRFTGDNRSYVIPMLLTVTQRV